MVVVHGLQFFFVLGPEVGFGIMGLAARTGETFGGGHGRMVFGVPGDDEAAIGTA